MDNIIKNSASVEFELCGKKESVSSNETEVNEIKLSLKKKACAGVLAGGALEYEITVGNDGVPVYGVLFKDVLQDGVDYVYGSFKIDGKEETPELTGQTLSYHIPEIEGNTEIIITFKVEINDGPEVSDPPLINAVYKNDKSVSGKGIAGASVEVTLHNGDIVYAPVDAVGDWTVTMHSGPWPKADDIVYAVQTEPGKLPSIKIQSIVTD